MMPDRILFWRGAAVLCALAVVVLTLLPQDLLPFALEPDVDSPLRQLILQVATLAGLALLVTLLFLRLLRLRIRVGGRRLSRPLSILLVAYVICLVMIASPGSRETVWAMLTDWTPAWLALAMEELSAGHVVAWGGLSFLLAMGWGATLGPRFLILAAFAMSGALELAQEFVPGRGANWWDLLSNGLGALMGVSAASLFVRPPEADVAAGTRRRDATRRKHRRRRRSAGVPSERRALRHR